MRALLVPVASAWARLRAARWPRARLATVLLVVVLAHAGLWRHMTAQAPQPAPPPQWVSVSWHSQAGEQPQAAAQRLTAVQAHVSAPPGGAPIPAARPAPPTLAKAHAKPRRVAPAQPSVQPTDQPAQPRTVAAPTPVIPADKWAPRPQLADASAPVLPAPMPHVSADATLASATPSAATPSAAGALPRTVSGGDRATAGDATKGAPPAAAARPAAGATVLPSLHNPKPVYPRLSQRLGEQGEVLLRARIDESGRVGEVELLRSSGFERLDEAARSAVRRWSYVLAADMRAAPQWLVVPVNFVLSAQ